MPTAVAPAENPPEPIEEQEFDLLAFDLWHLGTCPDRTDIEEWEDDPSIPGRRGRCI